MARKNLTRKPQPAMTAILFDTPETFAVELADGSVRVGVKNAFSITYPVGHAKHAAAAAVRSDDAARAVLGFA